MNRVDSNWILQSRVDGSVKPSRLKEIWALCILVCICNTYTNYVFWLYTMYDHCDQGLKSLFSSIFSNN